jgi:hypothetical protein
MSSADTNTAEDLIARPASGLASDDREAFRQAAEAALSSSGQCWGPGSIYRTVMPLWRKYFHPPAIPVTTWNHEGRPPNALIDADAIGRSPSRSRST